MSFQEEFIALLKKHKTVPPLKGWAILKSPLRESKSEALSGSGSVQAE
jgi:hypothetical protein